MKLDPLRSSFILLKKIFKNRFCSKTLLKKRKTAGKGAWSAKYVAKIGKVNQKSKMREGCVQFRAIGKRFIPTNNRNIWKHD